MVAAVSSRDGSEGFMMNKNCSKSEDLIKIIPIIEQRGNNFALLMDKATWHLSE